MHACIKYIIRHELHYIHTHTQTYKHTDTDRQTDKQAGRQAGRQADKHTYSISVCICVHLFCMYSICLWKTLFQMCILKEQKNMRKATHHTNPSPADPNPIALYNALHRTTSMNNQSILTHVVCSITKKTVPWVTRYLLNINTLRSQHGHGGWRCPAL